MWRKDIDSTSQDHTPTYTLTGSGHNNGNTWKFQTNLFEYGCLIVALP